MKNIFIAIVMLTAFSAVAQVTEKNLPNSPPPYGAYLLDSVKWPFEKVQSTRDTIARHYGYTNAIDAAIACKKIRPDCHDPVRHKRDSDPTAIAEMQKFGYTSWEVSVNACVKNIQRGDAMHCEVDPFLKLRRNAK